MQGVPAERVTERLRLPYAYTMGLVALRCGNGTSQQRRTPELSDTPEGGLPGDCDGILKALGDLTG